MKALIAATIWAMLMTISGTASADEALARKNNCLACHGVDRKALGPALTDVAARYRGDTGAEARLFAKVKAGGKGVWGPIPMAPQRQVKDEDLHKILHWILGLRGPTVVVQPPSTR